MRQIEEGIFYEDSFPGVTLGAIVYPEGAFYSRLEVKDVAVIAEEHLLKGRIVKDLLYKGAFEKDTIRSLSNVDFIKNKKGIQ